MKRILVGLFAIAVIGISAASAADMPTKAPPKQPVDQAVYNWTGFYVGAHVGYGWADPNIMPVGGGSVINHPMPAGALGGGQIGVNWQTNAWVLGIESDASYGNLDDTRTCTLLPSGTTLSCRGAPKYFGTIDGRLGYAVGQSLWFVKGGGAWSHEDFTQLGITAPVCVGAPCNGSAVQWGWTMGGGLEYGFAPNWSAKLEYDFLDFDHADRVTVTNGTSSNVFNLTKTIQTVQFGVNYRFVSR